MWYGYFLILCRAPFESLCYLWVTSLFVDLFPAHFNLYSPLERLPDLNYNYLRIWEAEKRWSLNIFDSGGILIWVLAEHNFCQCYALSHIATTDFGQVQYNYLLKPCCTIYIERGLTLQNLMDANSKLIFIGPGFWYSIVVEDLTAFAFVSHWLCFINAIVVEPYSF